MTLHKSSSQLTEIVPPFPTAAGGSKSQSDRIKDNETIGCESLSEKRDFISCRKAAKQRNQFMMTKLSSIDFSGFTTMEQLFIHEMDGRPLRASPGSTVGKSGDTAGSAR